MKSGLDAIHNEPVLSFEHTRDWAAWLESNHLRSSGIWLRLAKKAANVSVQSVSYGQALEEALCYGWIDGQKKSLDGTWWLQRFTPRGARSIWSKVNREKVEELIKRGKMKPACLAAVERARRDGRWDAAYDSPSRTTVPRDFQEELDGNAQARAFWGTLNSTNRYSILHRIQTARKEETRRKRIQRFASMLAKKEKLYP